MLGVRLSLVSILIFALLGCSPSDVGNQSSASPVAVAAAVGVAAGLRPQHLPLVQPLHRHPSAPLPGSGASPPRGGGTGRKRGAGG